MSRLLPEMGDLSPVIIPKEHQSSRSYRLDLERKRIVGNIDEQEAVNQAIEKRLRTVSDAHQIYGDSGYGIATEYLIGQDRFIVEAELKRRIIESLMADDRVVKVHSIRFSGGLDDLHASFIVDTIFGNGLHERRFEMQ